MKDLITGLTLPFRAFRLVFTRGRLFALTMLGALVTAITLIGSAWGSWQLATLLAHRWFEGTVGQVATEMLLWVVLFPLAALTLPNLVLAPLQDPLSEATEQLETGRPAPPTNLGHAMRGTVTSLSHTVARLGLMVLGLVVLWPLNLIPGVGSAAWVATSGAWSAFWLSVEHLSTPAARRLHPFGQVVRLARGRLALTLGAGLTLSAMLWVPVVNFFVMPVAVVSGTLLFLRMEGNAEPGGGVGR